MISRKVSIDLHPFIWIWFCSLLFIEASGAQNFQFSADSVITIANMAPAMVCADFNGDLAPDLAVAIDYAAIQNPVAIFLNDGNGIIATSPDSVYANSQPVKGIAAGDLNNDQIPDLASSRYQDSTISILIGKGDGTFSTASPLEVPSKPGPLVIADFNRDENNDLAVISQFGFLFIYPGNGDGTFLSPETYLSGGTSIDIEVCELNNDAYPDLLIGIGNTQSMSLLLNDGSGNFDQRTVIHTYRTPWYPNVGHFNSDTIPDIAVGSGSWDYDNIFIFIGDSVGKFACVDTASPCLNVRDMVVDDFNDDGKDDLLVGDRDGIYILQIDDQGNFMSTDTIDRLDYYQTSMTQSADIDGNGRADLIIGRDGQVSIYYNQEPSSSLEWEEQIVQAFELLQNYPNPFNPRTIISWKLAVGSKVDLSIYNVLGQKVATLISEKQPAGSYKVEWDASGLTSGIYFYRLTAGDLSWTRKMIYLR